jgi:glutathione S-transferase
MYKLLGRATSGNVQKVLFLLEELGVPYERLDYGRQFENTTTPEYLAMTPTAKVPTLVDGEVSIWESHSILRYLAAKEKATGLYPAELARRSQVERWMDWMLASLNPVFLAGFRDAKKPENERGADTVKNLAAELKLLDGQLARTPFVAGSELTIADMTLGPVVRRCVAFPFELPATPKVAAWLERLNARASFKKAIAAG